MYLEDFLVFLEAEKRYSKWTIGAYRIDLKQFGQYLVSMYELEELEKVSHNEIRSWIVYLMERKISARSIARKVSVLKSFYKYLMVQGVLKKTPLSKVILPKVSVKLPVYVEKANMETLLNVVEFEEGFVGERDRLLLEVFYQTGMRRAELMNLKVSDIDTYGLQVKVLGKGNKERIIPIHPGLLKGIRVYRETVEMTFENNDSPYLFLSDKGKQMNETEIHKSVKKYLSLVTTAEKKSPHVLRHSFATHLMNNGADINAVKELLGHASLAATQVYTHNTIDSWKAVYKQAHPKA